jgi:drug/metabolite transporter (DMT)-like permease
VLTGSFLHALWNMLVRRGAHPEAFAWWLAAAATVVYLPLGAYLLMTVGLPRPGWPFVAVTAVVHVFYFILLGRAYEHGDLGLVYPIARGTGPLLVPAIAIPLLGERVSPLGAAGVALIVVGVVTLGAGGFGPAAARRLGEAVRHPAARYAFATGVTIAIYSVNDKAGVARVHPVLYGYLLFLGSSILAAPYFWLARRQATVACWRANRRSIVLAGVLSPLTYFLALVAFQLGPVSYLAPMRELSIVVAAVLGTVVLGERFSKARMVSSGLTALGVVLIGLGA